MMKEDVKTWLAEQFGDDEETIAAVWAEYLSASEAKVADARAALAAADFPLLDRVAHTMKGNALMVGDQTSAQEAIQLREAAIASNPAAAQKSIDRLDELARENRA